jgi:hypothetical protein
MTPREQFARLLDSHLAPALKQCGFTRAGQTFRRRIGSNWAVVNVQRSSKSSSDQIVFTVSLGVASEALTRFAGGDPEKPATMGDCRLVERLGPLVFDGEDHWWVLDRETADSQRLAERLAAQMTDRAVPFLKEHADDKRIRDLWLSARHHQNLHWRDLCVLLHLYGPSGSLKELLDQLKRRYKYNPSALAGIEEHERRLV